MFAEKIADQMPLTLAIQSGIPVHETKTDGTDKRPSTPINPSTRTGATTTPDGSAAFIVQHFTILPDRVSPLLTSLAGKTAGQLMSASPLSSLEANATHPEVGGSPTTPAIAGGRPSGKETAAKTDASAKAAGIESLASRKTDSPPTTAAGVKAPTAGKADPSDSPAGASKTTDLAKEFVSSDPASTNSAAESATISSLPEISAAPVVKVKLAAATSAGTSGIPAAKLDIPMKNTGKMNEIAGLTEKVLPGNAGLAADENNLPRPAIPPLATASNGPMAAYSDSAAHVQQSSSALGGASASSAIISPVVDLRSRALERTHDMVALQATRLVESGSDTLHVVIKPGAGMQLSLELRQQGDGIEAQAVLQRGDFNHLNQHWPELQQRLEQRGIRLASLTGNETALTSDGQGGSQPHSQPESPDADGLAAGAFAEFALSGPALPSPTPSSASRSSHRGWETWA